MKRFPMEGRGRTWEYGILCWLRYALFLFLFVLFFPDGTLKAESKTWYLPGAAETSGLNGARFSSTLFLNNRDSTIATAQIGLIPYEGKSPPSLVARTMAPGETLRIPAVLNTLFGLSSDAGTLVLTSENELGMWLTTANVASLAGTYGLAMAPYSPRNIITAGLTGHAIWINQGEDYRTNIALSLLDPDTEAKLTFYNQEGLALSMATVSSHDPISWQASMGRVLPLGRVEVYVSRGRAGAYTAVVDNVTNDGIAVMAEISSSDPAELLVNGVVLSPGLNGTYWSTDVRLFNPLLTAQDVVLSWLGPSLHHFPLVCYVHYVPYLTGTLKLKMLSSFVLCLLSMGQSLDLYLMLV